LEFAFQYQNKKYDFKGQVHGSTMAGNLNNNPALAIAGQR